MLKKAIKKFVNIAGYKVEKIFTDGDLSFTDMEKDFKGIYQKCCLYTMTSIERMYALYKAVKYMGKTRFPEI